MAGIDLLQKDWVTEDTCMPRKVMAPCMMAGMLLHGHLHGTVAASTPALPQQLVKTWQRSGKCQSMVATPFVCPFLATDKQTPTL
jgi:hypothetical protein